MSHACEKGHFQGGTLFRGKISQHATDFFDGQPARRDLLEIHSAGDGDFVNVFFMRAFAHHINSAVTRDHRQPRRQTSTLGVKDLRLTPELEEDFLQNVFGSGGVPEHAQSHTVNNAGIAVVEVGHGVLGVLILVAKARDQGCVVLWGCRLPASQAPPRFLYVRCGPPDGLKGSPEANMPTHEDTNRTGTAQIVQCQGNIFACYHLRLCETERGHSSFVCWCSLLWPCARRRRISPLRNWAMESMLRSA